MKKKLTFLAYLLLASATLLTAANPKVIAHRGYWKCDGSYENTISALKNAINLDIYGSEFDVRLTADNILVVHHDAKTKQGTPIEKSDFAQVVKDTLPNGELIPTLEQYLIEGGKQKNTKLILELKTNKDKNRQKLSVEKTVELVKKLRLEKMVEYIVFDNQSGKDLIRLAPKAKVAYLNGDLNPDEVKNIGYTGIDYQIKVLRQHPEWIKECQKIKITVNVWTVDKAEDMDFFINNKVDYITTNQPLKLLTEKLRK